MPRTLEILDRQLITKGNNPANKGDGRHRVQKQGRAEVFADVRRGKIVGFHATSAGRRVATASIMTDPGGKRPPFCSFCVNVDGTRWICWRVPC